ncbi:MAG: AraC family transcriptional regulator [Sphingobacteriales bacterium]|nr:MAG: AraC family transcriptional regulator [Sphingobacteriales bacterium]TAF78295.1 MAG: AraC family transcriptional regulator [Sphingobacteriales bacterium]
MIFNLSVNGQFTYNAKISPALFSNIKVEKKTINFHQHGTIATGIQLSFARFLFINVKIIPASPIKLYFILPNNYCVIGCSYNTQLQHALGFIKYTPVEPISISKSLFINALCCVYPYGDALIAPQISTHYSMLMQKIFNEMVHCNKLGLSKCLFLKAKCYEILSLVGEPISHYPRIADEKQKHILRPDDAEKISEAKAIIATSLQNPYSLVELAHKVGLNDFKLKKYFKEVYGTTVFGYLHHIRMQKACTLLKQKQKISEVAYAVGYKNAQHFTAAFKKYFGLVPSAFLTKNQ